MPNSTAVKWIRNDMRAAPVITGNTPSSLIAALDALLVTGWGSVTAVSASVTSGVATITFNAGSSFTEHAVVLVAGAAPEQLNGEQRVLTASNTQITFATTAPDGTASGSITVKNAPAGWEKVFVGTNKAVYRSANIAGNRHYLRVDDTANLFARVRGYEAMTDVDTGSNPFPTDTQISGGGYWVKSVTANSTAVPYLLAADNRALLVTLQFGRTADSTYTSSAVRGFGDPIALNPSGDAWGSFLSADSVSTGFNIHYGALSGSRADSSGSYGLTVSPRGWQGLGSATLQRVMPYVGDPAKHSGASDNLGAMPSVVDGQIKTSPLFLKDQASGMPPRSNIPGLYYLPQSAGRTALPTPYSRQILADGRSTLVVHTGDSYNSSSGDSVGVVLLDITGPWR